MDRPGGRLYYGWTIVGALFLFNFAGQAGGTLNFGLFVLPMSEELGLSRQLVGWAQTVRLWAGGLSGIILGRWLDRYGPRGPMLVAILVAAGGLLWLAHAQSAAVLFAVLMALGASGWTAPGGGGLMATVPVAKWFVRMRGRATGIVQLGLGIGGVVLLPLTQVLIDRHGWRAAWIVLAAISAATLPLVLLLRRQPSDLGLQPDGGPARTTPAPADGPVTVAALRRRPAPQASWTLAAAIRTPTMWQLCAAFALLAFLTGAASVNRVPHWVELGFSPELVSIAFGVDAVAATVMALAAGFVVEHLDARIVGAIASGSFCLSLLLMLAESAWAPLLFASTVLFGAAIGLYMVVHGIIWAQYFGWRFVGTIRGVVLPLSVLAGGFGAPLVGAMRDAAGNYRAAWLLMLPLTVAGGLLILTARHPRAPARPGPPVEEGPDAAA